MLFFAVGARISNQTILCSGSHVSYKGFAIDNQIEQLPLRSDLKQRVKEFAKISVEDTGNL